MHMAFGVDWTPSYLSSVPTSRVSRHSAPPMVLLSYYPSRNYFNMLVDIEPVKVPSFDPNNVKFLDPSRKGQETTSTIACGDQCCVVSPLSSVRIWNPLSHLAHSVNDVALPNRTQTSTHGLILRLRILKPSSLSLQMPLLVTSPFCVADRVTKCVDSQFPSRLVAVITKPHLQVYFKLRGYTKDSAPPDMPPSDTITQSGASVSVRHEYGED